MTRALIPDWASFFVNFEGIKGCGGAGVWTHDHQIPSKCDDHSNLVEPVRSSLF